MWITCGVLFEATCGPKAGASVFITCEAFICIGISMPTMIYDSFVGILGNRENIALTLNYGFIFILVPYLTNRCR